jgi:ATP-dependent 26S proteasome regulatory subunit
MELPLTHLELYEDIGIKPPKGVIFYGEPRTGKTLLAKVSFVSAGRTAHDWGILLFLVVIGTNAWGAI